MIQISDFLSFKMLDKKFSLRRIARVSISTCKSFFENVLSLPTSSKQSKYVLIFVSNRFL